MAWTISSQTLPLAIPLIKQFEGFRAAPYLCPAKRWTIGYGTTKYPDGRKVTANDEPISQLTALRYLQASVERVERDLHPLLLREPTPQQHAALICLAYNIGVGAHDGVKGDLADSTLLARFNAGLIAAASDQFLVWNKAHVDGKVEELPGLTKRRQAERALFRSAA